MAALFLAVLAAAGPGAATPQGPRTARLTLRIQHRFRQAPLRMDEGGLVTRTGDKLSVSRLAYLVSDVALIRADGGQVEVPSVPAYLNPTEERSSLTLAGIPSGEYRGVVFHVGLDAKTNHLSPSRYAPTHPLNPRVCGLHWGWQSGYVFLAIEGGYAAQDGRLRGYSYHLGNDANRVTVRVPGALRIEGDTLANLVLDVERLFSGISPSPRNGADSTHSAPGDSLAARLRTNVASAFTLTAAAPERAAVRSSRVSRKAKDPVRPNPAATATAAHPFALKIPDGFPQPALPADNPLTLEGTALGKRLFFEKKLSGNGSQSCAGCHRPETAFADGGRSRSRGIDHLPGTRRTMPLFNLAWSAPYTWDGRRKRLRDQATAPIVNPREMHASLTVALRRLRASSGYPRLFRQAFGSPAITSERIGLALEQYLLTLVSADSKFDRATRGELKFTEQEKRGLLLFVTEYDPARGRIGADCFHCHGGNLFSDYRYTNNGIDDRFADRGRANITHRDADLGKFKTPSLRNVALTAPYMHDGRFQSLEQVVDHYTHGVRRTASLDPNIAKHPDSGMELTSEDRAALVAFLKTLTDPAYLPKPGSLDQGAADPPEPSRRKLLRRAAEHHPAVRSRRMASPTHAARRPFPHAPSGRQILSRDLQYQSTS